MQRARQRTCPSLPACWGVIRAASPVGATKAAKDHRVDTLAGEGAVSYTVEPLDACGVKGHAQHAKGAPAAETKDVSWRRR